MGATQATWLVMSPTRAAGSLSIVTVAEPFTIMPGPPGTQDGSVQIFVVSRHARGGFFADGDGRRTGDDGQGQGGMRHRRRHQGRRMDGSMAMRRGLQHHIPEPRGGLAHEPAPSRLVRVRRSANRVKTIQHRLDRARELG